MMKPDSKRPITIEDLLRLKRAERPPAEFWTEFDRALRAKQLAALVEKRPWWHGIPRLLAGFGRYRIPIGASAIVALSFLTVREYRGWNASLQSPQAVRETLASAAATPASSRATEHPEIIATVSDRAGESPAGSVASELNENAAPAATLASEATSPGEISRMLPLIGTPVGDPAEEELSPSARAIAANLASVRGSEPVLTRTLLSNASGAEIQAVRPVAIEPLQQIAAPGDRRRSNLLTAMVSMSAFEGPNRAAEHAAATRLSPDELYDRIHRFGARGNAVNMKF